VVGSVKQRGAQIIYSYILVLHSFHHWNIHGYTLKTKYKNIMIFTISPSLLVLETLQNHFIFIFYFKILFLIFFFVNNKKKKKKA
jgi:hypothetical protein